MATKATSKDGKPRAASKPKKRRSTAKETKRPTKPKKRSSGAKATSAKAKSSAKGAKKEELKICNLCGAENPQDATECQECGKDRFAPAFIKALRPITRNFSVQVSDSFDEGGDPRLTLYKWWPVGNRSTLHINSQDHWDRIKEVVDTELADHLGWASKKKISDEIKARKEASEEFDAEAKGLLVRNPELFAEIAGGLKLDSVSKEDLPGLVDSLGKIAKILAGVDENHQLAIRQLVEQLPKQKAAAISQLTDLMSELTLGQITAVTNEVRRRVALLETFTDRINDDRTYEITGDDSIHRLLERAMWIVDERYWLMHSNKQLRTVVTKELIKEDKKFEKKRPDFVCGTVDNKLIIIEIKRPSHTLQLEDLNQLERYIVLCEKYDDEHSSFEAILVGPKASDELRSTLKVRSNSFKVRTYTQLVEDSRKRYTRYLEALES